MATTSQLGVPIETLAAQVRDLLMQGGNIGMTLNYEEQDYELLYTLGHTAYEQARYNDAVKVFGYLVLLNQFEARYTNALASSLHMCKNYAEAMKYYTLVSVMDMTDPLPTFHTCECMLAMGMLKETREGLVIVISQCKDASREPLKARAQAMLELLDKSATTPSTVKA
jgi:type III secretion system low calcium response chaperone LcrH/SycD